MPYESRLRTCKLTPPIVGLDMSLTGTAAVSIPAGWDRDVSKVRSVLVGYPLAKSSQEERFTRITSIVLRVVDFVRETWRESDARMMRAAMPVVFIEGYAYSARSSSVIQLAELGGVIRYELARKFGIVAREMTASRARVYLLGKLPRGKGTQKPAVVAALRACGCEFGSVDEFDAMCVANAGLAEVGGCGFTMAVPDVVGR